MNDKTLNCSDLDRFMGKPMEEARMKEPLHNNDFRRWLKECTIRTCCTTIMISPQRAVMENSSPAVVRGRHR